ncbi:MAG TPA: WD40 repeat domain-containing protein, partial [Phototrophicaceae bacterium]|nr:WD40 repeat domain-containing protein [Phototrophicaceae bacterium]
LVAFATSVAYEAETKVAVVQAEVSAEAQAGETREAELQATTTALAVELATAEAQAAVVEATQEAVDEQLAALQATITAETETQATRQANTQATLEAQATELAEGSTALAVADEKIAQLTEDAQNNTGTFLAAESLRLVDQNYPLALLLGVEASRRLETAQIGDSLFTALNSRLEVADILQGHTDDVFALAYSPDGRLLATGGGDSRVILWDTTTGERVGAMLGDHSNSIFALAFSADGQTLASAGADGTVVLWDVATDERIGPRLVHENWVSTLAFSPDGTTLAAGDYSGLLTLWDVASGQMMGQPLTGHTDMIRTLAFSPDGTTLASGGVDQTIILWNIENATVGRQFTGHADWVNSLAFSADGKTLVSGGADGQIRVWDVRSGELRGDPLFDGQPVSSVAYSPDGTQLLTVSNAVRLWDVSGGRPVLVAEYDAYSTGLWRAVFNPNGLQVASTKADDSVILWSLRPIKRLGQLLNAQNAPVRAVDFSADGRLLASGSADGTITVWDATTKQLVQQLDANSNGVFSLAFSPDGAWLASGGGDTTIKLWDVISGQPVGEPMSGHTDAVLSLDFSADGKMLVSGSGDGTLRFWDVTGRQLGEPIAAHSDSVWMAAFSPDGKTVASVSSDGTVMLWDVTTRQPKGDALLGHFGQVFTLAFSPDGTTLASGGDYGSIIIWDVAAGVARFTIEATDSSVFALAFSPDSRTLVSGGADGIVSAWDVLTGQPLVHPLAVLPDWVNTLAFGAGGKYLAAGVGSQDVNQSSVYLWDLHLDVWQETACNLAGRNLTLTEWQAYFGETTYQRTCAELPAHQSVIQDVVDRAETAGAVGDLETAKSAYALAAEWLVGAEYPDLSNNVCWFGSLYGFAETVLPVCEKMVELVPAHGNFYDTRGVARALTGNLDGALEDFRVFTGWAEGRDGYDQFVTRRQEWITKLTAGENPIDEQTIQELLAE